MGIDASADHPSDKLERLFAAPQSDPIPPAAAPNGEGGEVGVPAGSPHPDDDVARRLDAIERHFTTLRRQLEGAFAEVLARMDRFERRIDAKMTLANAELDEAIASVRRTVLDTQEPVDRARDDAAGEHPGAEALPQLAAIADQIARLAEATAAQGESLRELRASVSPGVGSS